MRASRFLAALLLFAVLSSAGTYTLQWGDTLGGVARRFGVPVGSLAAANGIKDPNLVREGQVLTIPSAGAPPASAGARTHRVGRGETLGAIARRYGTTVARLAQVNGIGDPNRVREGAVLQLDAAAQWVCPVTGIVRFVSGFGEPRGEGRRHEGVDVVAPEGRTVVANVSGFFKRASNPRGGHAYYLEGDDGVVYYGAHLSEYVGFNRWVPMGEAIGKVGETGNAAGTIPHLHFERLPGGGAAIDPYPLLAPACPTR